LARPYEVSMIYPAPLKRWSCSILDVYML
jgi:hypothetical protein